MRSTFLFTLLVAFAFACLSCTVRAEPDQIDTGNRYWAEAILLPNRPDSYPKKLSLMMNAALTFGPGRVESSHVIISAASSGLLEESDDSLLDRLCSIAEGRILEHGAQTDLATRVFREWFEASEPDWKAVIRESLRKEATIDAAFMLVSGADKRFRELSLQAVILYSPTTIESILPAVRYLEGMPNENGAGFFLLAGAFVKEREFGKVSAVLKRCNQCKRIHINDFSVSPSDTTIVVPRTSVSETVGLVGYTASNNVMQSLRRVYLDRANNGPVEFVSCFASILNEEDLDEGERSLVAKRMVITWLQMHVSDDLSPYQFYIGLQTGRAACEHLLSRNALPERIATYWRGLNKELEGDMALRRLLSTAGSELAKKGESPKAEELRLLRAALMRSGICRESISESAGALGVTIE